MDENDIKEIKDKIERLYRDYHDKMDNLVREGERETEQFLYEIEKLTKC